MTDRKETLSTAINDQLNALILPDAVKDSIRKGMPDLTLSDLEALFNGLTKLSKETGAILSSGAQELRNIPT